MIIRHNDLELHKGVQSVSENFIEALQCHTKQLRTSFGRSTSRIERRLENLQSHQNTMQRKLDAVLSNFDELYTSVVGTEAVFSGSAAQAIVSLSHVYPHLHDVIRRLITGNQINDSSEHRHWLELEFNTLLESVVSISAQKTKSSILKEDQHEIRSPIWPNLRRKPVYASPKQALAHDRPALYNKQISHSKDFTAQILDRRPSMIFRNITEINLPTGKLIVVVTQELCSPEKNRSVLIVRLIFVPRLQFQISGFA